MDTNRDIMHALQRLLDSKKDTGRSMGQIIQGIKNRRELSYWDYIRLDTLLSLQAPITNYPDEKLFLIYHQITELYLKLIIHEITSLTSKDYISRDFWVKHISRACQNLQILLSSLDVFSEQLEHDEFSEFRYSLAPASGFQSYQFRYLELICTPLENLISQDSKVKDRNRADMVELYKSIYWKSAGRDQNTRKKSHMLVEFENKYDSDLLHIAQSFATKNVWTLFKSQPRKIQRDGFLQSLLREFDFNFNIAWSIKHYELAAKHLLGTDSIDEKSTGNTNWCKFLPHKCQYISFFPDLWSSDEHAEWSSRTNFTHTTSMLCVRESHDG